MWSGASSDSNVETLSMYERYVEEKTNQERELEEVRIRRRNTFENYLDEHRSEVRSIFNFIGVQFYEFTHERIIFYFTPSDVAQHFLKDHVFKVILKYRNYYWRISGLTRVPLDAKNIYQIFATFQVNDGNVVQSIKQIFHALKQWCENYSNQKYLIYQRYLKGEDVFFFSEDEEIFLDEEQRNAARDRRNRIWQRMLPPPESRRRTRRRSRRT